MPFMSYAQNFEDVMLWRALSHVDNGFYIDVGAGDPDFCSVTRAFYERGWSGVNVEPDPAPFQALVRKRERDVNLPVALAEQSGERPFHIPSVPGLATLDTRIAFQHRTRGMEVRPIQVTVSTLAELCRRHVTGSIHFLKIDAEGAEGAILRGADFAAFRPWIVVAESTVPMTRQENHAEWEKLLLDADYRFVWFDGLNRFYLAAEQYAALAPHFQLPPNHFDQFEIFDFDKQALAVALEQARSELAAAQDELRVMQDRLAGVRRKLRQVADEAEAW